MCLAVLSCRARREKAALRSLLQRPPPLPQKQRKKKPSCTPSPAQTPALPSASARLRSPRRRAPCAWRGPGLPPGEKSGPRASAARRWLGSTRGPQTRPRPPLPPPQPQPQQQQQQQQQGRRGRRRAPAQPLGFRRFCWPRGQRGIDASSRPRRARTPPRPPLGRRRRWTRGRTACAAWRTAPRPAAKRRRPAP